MIIDKKMINDEYEYLCQNAELEFINIKSNESFDKGDKKYIKYTKSFSF